jgi:putative transposase
MMETVALHGPRLGVGRLCRALAVPRATYYRHLEAKAPPPRPTPTRALAVAERSAVLDVLHEPRFADQAPAEIYARLLDENRYLCSERTMYRILAANAEVRERRDQLRHPAYKKPELLATAPNQVWSWDITKLLGPAKWTYFYLYVVLDIFSRYVVGWMIAHRESATLAKKLIEEACQRQRITAGQLAIHADRGPSMTSKTIAHLYADLGVTQSHSRPNVSNDNPFSEAQFKTLKYRPDFPERFGSAQHGRAHCGSFFDWYNHEHRHGGIGLLTPHDVHYGLADQRVAARAFVLAAAHAAHPERFSAGVPMPPPAPTAVWINPPLQTSSDVEEAH